MGGTYLSMPNRLASETSPYLLQHADNPVDWYPWGDEAFARARAEDKPVLVSIGYAACHWCHVMEHESFEDASVAALMNERFVCVKVDREERPDVDAIYMDAVQAMTGPGRLAAERVPDARRRAVLGRHVLPAAAAPRAAVLAQVLDGARAGLGGRSAPRSRRRRSGIVPRLQGAAALEAPDAELDPAALDAAVAALQRRLRRRARRLGRRAEVPGVVGDRVPAGARRARRCRCRRCGGWPRAASTTRSAAASRATRSTRAGSSRTSRRCSTTTRCWPGRTCTRSRSSSEPLFRRVCEETLDWAMRELRQDEGGFASSLDADTEGVEGKFYVWTPAEIRAALGDELGGAAMRALRRHRGGQLRGARTSSCGRRRTRRRCGEIKAAAARRARGAGAAGAGRQAADVAGTR